MCIECITCTKKKIQQEEEEEKEVATCELDVFKILENNIGDELKKKRTPNFERLRS